MVWGDVSDMSIGTGSSKGRETRGDPNVDFPTFVANLIEGVFNAVVSASIQQMDAYAELVQSVAKSLNDFVDEAAEAGAECLDGLCVTRAGANAATTSSWQHDADASAATPKSAGEP